MTFAFAGQWGPEAFINSGGRVQPNAVLALYDADGMTLSTRYTDRTKATTAINPWAADAQGNATFFAEPGPHVLVVTVGGVVTDLSITVPADPDEGASDDAVTLATATGRAIAFALVFGG